MLVFSTYACAHVAAPLAYAVGCPFVPIVLSSFADGELSVDFKEDLDGEDVVIVQLFSSSVHKDLMTLLVCLRAVRSRGARTVIAVAPYIWYGRDDTNGSLVIDLIKAAGADEILAVDFHASSPRSSSLHASINSVENIDPLPVLLKHLSPIPDVVVAPDRGSWKRAQRAAALLDLPVLLFEKIRQNDGSCCVRTSSVPRGGCTCVIVDDIVSTGNTLSSVVDALAQGGVTHVCACITHMISFPAFPPELKRIYTLNLFASRDVSSPLIHSVEGHSLFVVPLFSRFEKGKCKKRWPHS